MKDGVLGLPFLTRDMLAFQEGRPFGLRVEVISVTDERLTLKGFTKEGPFQYGINTAGADTEEIFNFSIPDIPIMLTFDRLASGGTPLYVKIAVYLTINDSKYAALIQGSITGGETLSWPSQLPIQEIQQRGYFDQTNGAAPAAGANASIAIPATQWWRVKSIMFDLTAAVAVANRSVKLNMTNAFGESVFLLTGILQTAGQTRRYNFWEGVDTVNDVTSEMIQCPLPTDFWLQPSTSLITAITNLQAGDQLSAITISGERFYQKS